MKKEEGEKDVRRNKHRKRKSSLEISKESPKNWIKMEEAAVAVQSITRVRDKEQSLTTEFIVKCC